jgi:hypothetical protein
MKSPPLPEPHYSVRVLAECWNLDPSTVLHWFQDRPGVLRVGDAKSKRMEIRIPRSIAEQVYTERTK